MHANIGWDNLGSSSHNSQVELHQGSFDSSHEHPVLMRKNILAQQSNLCIMFVDPVVTFLALPEWNFKDLHNAYKVLGESVRKCQAASGLELPQQDLLGCAPVSAQVEVN